MDPHPWRGTLGCGCRSDFPGSVAIEASAMGPVAPPGLEHTPPGRRSSVWRTVNKRGPRSAEAECWFEEDAGVGAASEAGTRLPGRVFHRLRAAPAYGRNSGGPVDPLSVARRSGVPPKSGPQRFAGAELCSSFYQRVRCGRGCGARIWKGSCVVAPGVPL
jgi:hypothetical protein